MIASDPLLALIQEIHASALEPGLWPSVLAKVQALVGADVGTLFIQDFSDGTASLDGVGPDVSAFIGFDPHYLQSYVEHFSHLNVWTANEDALPSGSAVTSSMLYPDSQLKRTEFYGDWLQRQDLFYALGSVVEKEGSRAVKMTFLRPERAGNYDRDALDLMRILMPHLRIAVAVHRRMHGVSQRLDSSFGALDALRFGIVLLSREGTFVHWNRAAQRIADRTGALRLGSGGTLSAVSAALTSTLAAEIRKAGMASSASAAHVRLATLNGKPLNVFVAPISMPGRVLDARRAATALFITDPDGEVPDLARSLMSVYKLSPAEAALVEGLVAGKALKEIARERDVSLNTIRTQLQAASAKVGVKRQVDLVREVLTGPAVLLANRPPGLVR